MKGAGHVLTKLTEQELSVISSNNGLQRYLESLLVGRKATPRSWLYEQISAEEVLAEWENHLAVLREGSATDREVYQFDTLQKKKWGPQGEVRPIGELMEIVERGFGESPTPKAFSDPLWAFAKEIVHEKLVYCGCVSLRPASYQRVVDDMRARDTLESNSGWPLFTRRNKPEVVKQSIADAESGAWKDYPAIALFRNYNLKTRLVWMYPMSTNIVEGSYFQVLQSAIVKSGARFTAPWIGFEAVRSVVSNSFDFGWFLSASDFSETDEHFKLAATEQVADVLEKCFQQRFRPGLRESLRHMNTIPLVIGPEQKVVGGHGVSSGSNWTNFVETIFDWILAYYVLFKQSGLDWTARKAAMYAPSGIYVPENVSHQGLYAIGDDMTWVSGKYDKDFADFLERIGESVGMKIKAEKATNEPDKLVSLQRLFIRGYRRPDGQIRAVYPTIRALKSSVYPERFHDPRLWSSDMFCARQYMILENCVDHPLFEEFVEFVVAGQKDLIPFAKQSKAKLDQTLRKSRLLPGLNPTYNQERRDSSLDSFASIKFVREHL
nr:RNA-dependent RNA polymerase [Marmot picobirnavirus]